MECTPREEWGETKEQEMKNLEWRDYTTLGGEDKLLVLHFTRMLLCGAEIEKDLNIKFYLSIGLL